MPPLVRAKARIWPRRLADYTDCRPHSVDRTRSPAAVPQKGEYFKYPSETMGYFAPGRAKIAFGDSLLNRKSPPLAGRSGISQGRISSRRTAWLGRQDSNLRMGESKSAAM